MREVERVESIAALSRDAWNACFPGELEDYDYFLAIERARIGGFIHAYYVIREQDTILAAMPAFFTDYDLVTTADGTVKKILLAIRPFVPGKLKLKLACLG